VPRLPLAAVAAVLVSALLPAAPAAAQAAAAGPDDKFNMVIVYGNDECPQPKGDEITVCARKGENERYRIPEELRGSQSPANDAWNNKVMAYETVGRSGTQSCSPVGPGGATGCVQRLIDKAYAEKGQNPSIRFSELIAAERAKRLSTIDADAAATQARVEQAEQEYDARRQAEEAGKATPAPTPAPAAPTQTATGSPTGQ